MIRFCHDLTECEALWEQFSPHIRAWDEWELMYAFHDQNRYRLNFMVHETDGKVDGLIPLVEDSTDGSNELFGGSYPDSRDLWIRLEDFPEFYEQLPAKTDFFDLRGGYVDELLAMHPQYTENFTELDHQFYLVPADFDYDFDNHMLQNFSNDKRKSFQRDLRKIRERNIELVWNEADESDLFFALSVKNFGADSDHSTDGGKQEVRRVVSELKENGYLRTLTISVDGEKQATSMSALYNNYWVTLYAGSNNDFDNLGKLLNVETIQEACRLRVNEINYMTGMAWKAAWRMKQNPCRTMRKPARIAETVAETPATPAT
jgi:hypothetical protein